MSIFSRKNADGVYADKADKLRDMIDGNEPDIGELENAIAASAAELANTVREPEAILEADQKVIEGRMVQLSSKITGLRDAIKILSEELRQAEASNEAYSLAMGTIKKSMEVPQARKKPHENLLYPGENIKFNTVKDASVIVNDPNEILTKSVK